MVRTTGNDDLAEYVGDGPLRMTLSSPAYSTVREPTSRMGAMAMLRQHAAELKQGDAPWIMESRNGR